MRETILLDPTSELAPIARQPAPPLPSVKGAVVGLLDIAKPRGDVFLDRIAALLVRRGLAVERFRKPTNTKIAPPDLRRRIAERCRAVVVALAD
ncbi:MAG: hypothetical protein GEU81_09225 [Nitriliruptorales bacterium]|nr:hypothetical protein [Nitriliruptorales bacterium]